VKWIGISGSWRLSSAELVSDVRSSVTEIMLRGDGIVSGGALGVDQVATEEALSHNHKADRIRIIIPATLEIYAAHFRKRAGEGIITVAQAESLIDILTVIREKGSLIEMHFTELNEVSYYARNTSVLDASDELLAFQVNQSAGTQDAINKAHQLGIPVTVKRYVLD
jgi:hypothetical protein